MPRSATSPKNQKIDAQGRVRDIVATLQERRHRILIVEDNPTIRFMLAQHLGTLRQELLTAETIAQAEKMLQDHRVSLILLDLQLPDGDGRQLLVTLRARPATANIPIFVISSKKESSTQTECFALGADAYFQKPFDPQILYAAIAARLQKVINSTRHSTVDPLTSLPNRAAFTSAFNRASRLASRSGEPLSIAMLDLDRFKAVNDMHGHALGDQVLVRLTSVLGQSLRASDFLARWGGEEFSIFFPNTDLEEARVALAKALDAFRAELFAAPKGPPFRVTFSAGVARATHHMSAERGIANADRMLYLAKASGRDRVLTESDKVSLKKIIFLVEDDEQTASIIRRHLEHDGFKVLHARKAKSALRTIAPSVSLIIIDDKIPGSNGFDLLERYRAIPALLHVPIMMLTSAGAKEDIVRGFKLGADDYMVKPFSPRELLARIHRFVEKNDR